MLNCIKSLQDPHKVAAIQQYFGVVYNKKTGPKLLSLDNERTSEENVVMQRKFSAVSLPEFAEETVREHVSPVKATGQVELEAADNARTEQRIKNYTVKNKFWFYLFFFCTYLGDVAGYGFLLPFLIWNIDAVIGRKLVLVWTAVMYIGRYTVYIIRFAARINVIGRLFRFRNSVLTISFILGQALKEVLCVERPTCPPVIRMQIKWSKEYGMPSTHAMAGVALSSSVIYYGIRRYNVSYRKYDLDCRLFICRL